MGKKLYKRYCKFCGAKIITESANKRICGFCAEYNKSSNKEKRQRAYEPLWNITAEIEQYNKKHGTMLSYGKYVALLKFEKDKKKEKEKKKEDEK